MTNNNIVEILKVIFSIFAIFFFINLAIAMSWIISGQDYSYSLGITKSTIEIIRNLLV